jgi:hypothetical protein
MEKICPNCQAINPADGSFCRACATPIALIQPTYTEQQTEQWQPQNQQWQQPPAYQWQETPQNPQWQQPTPFGGPLQGQTPRPFQAAPSNRPVIALCLVIAGFMCCGPFLTIPGTIMGWMEMNAIKEGRSPQSGLSMAQIAFWGGIVATVLSTLGLIFGILGGIIGNINP